MKTANYKTLTIAIISILLFALYNLIAHTLPVPQDNDMQAHAMISKNILTGEWSILSRPFIMYALSILLSFFSENIYNILTAICVLLAIATTLRFYISQKTISKLALFSTPSKNYFLSTAIGLSLLFVFAIPIFTYLKNGTFYIGNFTPNVWHNSTTIFLMPFTILLYLEACKQIESYKRQRDLLLIIYIFLNIFIKPSFFFVFACAYPLALLIRYKFSKTFFRSLLPVVLGGLFLIAQYYLMYLVHNKDVSGQSNSGIGFGFFTLYSLYTGLRYLPISIISSLFFPIAYSVLNFKKLKKNIPYLFSVLLVAFAFLVYAIINETGPRFTDGNFYWQIIPCTWILFFILIIELLKDIKEYGFTLKNKILISIYILHVISGICYILRILIIHNYY